LSSGENDRKNIRPLLIVACVVLLPASCMIGSALYMGHVKDSVSKQAFVWRAIPELAQMRLYYLNSGKVPTTPQEAKAKERDEVDWDIHDTLEKVKLSYEITLTPTEIVVTTFGVSQHGSATLVFRPVWEKSVGDWDCTGGTLENDYRPLHCRRPGKSWWPWDD